MCAGISLRGRSSCRLAKGIGSLFLAFALVFAGSLPAFSQGNAGRILGAVTDQSGGAVVGATVTILDTARGTTRTLTTDQAGEYNAPNLIPSTYTVTAAFQGFKTAERSGVILEVNQDLRVDLTLQPGEQTQKITVTEALPMVETTNAELGGTLQSAIIADLPMNGRNFANLIQLRPGVTIYPGGSGWTQSSNGMRASDNVYLFEGVNGNDPWMAQPIITAVMASGDAGTLLSIDAIDEFKTEENPRAEYGWKPGAIVNVGLKSGTNNYHGSAFAYGRDGSWDANDFFVNSSGSTPAPVALEQFGATFGGPIKKDKLFYFLSFEDQRYTVGATGTISVPVTGPGLFDSTIGKSAAASNLIAACQAALAVGAPGSGVPGSLTALSAQLAGLSNTCTPLANYPGIFPSNSGTNPLGPSVIPDTLPNQNRIDSGVGKVDYHLNDKNSLNFMYEISPGSGLLNDSPSSQTNQAFETNQYARSQVFASSWTWTPNSTWVNEARVGYSHYYQQFLSNDSTQNPANYSLNGATYNFYTGQANPLYFGLPAIAISQFGGAEGASWPKVVGPDGVLQLLDHISYLRGKHAFKFGGEILGNTSTSNVTASTKGPITFDSLPDFFAGFPNGAASGVLTSLAASEPSSVGTGTATILVGNLLRHFTYQGYAAFLQDDWRVRPRLTLNLGLRYELDTVPVERDGLQGNFLPGTPTGLAQQGVGETLPYHGDHNNFSPRVGFAWDIFGNGKTVLRGGGGILYEMIALDVFNGIGNSFGLRANPTGALLCSGGAAGACTKGPGNIAVVNVSYNGTAVLNGNGTMANGETPGGIPSNWALNSPTTPLYSFVAACGDGNTGSTAAGGSSLPAGFKPPQCNAMLVDPNLRTPYVDTWSIDLQRSITSNLSLDIGYVGNHGTKLISALDINEPLSVTANVAGVGLTTFGPGYAAAGLATCAAAPSKANCGVNTTNENNARPYIGPYPYLRFVDDYGNIDDSNYNGLQAVLTARNFHGLTLTTGYSFSHALGVNSGQGTAGSNTLPINSYGNIHAQLYGPTTFDIRHKVTISGTYNIPGGKGYAQMLEGWSLNGAAIVQTGAPWHIADTTTDFAGTGEQLASGASGTEGSQWDFFGNPADFEPHDNFANLDPTSGGTYTPCTKAITAGCVVVNPSHATLPFFPGTTNLGLAPTANAACNSAAASQGPLALASLRVLGCYAVGSSVMTPAPYGGYGNMAYNAFRDQGFHNIDFSITKAFKIKENLSAQFRAEFFNIFNWVNFVNPFGGPGGNGGSLNPSTAGNGNGLAWVQSTPDQAGSNPVLGSGGARDIQLGLKLIF